MIPKIACFDDMVAAARRAGPVRVAVAAAHDPEVLMAVDQRPTGGAGPGEPGGRRPAIEALGGPGRRRPEPGVPFIHEPERIKAARHVVSLAREGQASVVVKGQVKTSELLGAALDRHHGHPRTRSV